ncbi:urease accessory protein UreD [Blochmannia endosymbiont of Camponotus (Colobopsis) obliquus]|uniref:urease accessory protein UreD n=1 Tax=Blochmannia endosymbiont of Camponotus (Colobopsis) obliquus TaxID=1505597 RepID=UPI00061A7D13|nr:urease accessory protein UreD [Blochmannia endosymbiont of Camponotus (Colobopsis) obliquus]AKC60672.1 urease accessory protein ureD [Blochmannia endosymbiont of Camponotus (Colobopsis) obliquus]
MYNSKWVGELKLCFDICKNGRTILSTLNHRGPFIVQRSFYPECNIPHVYLLYPPGGLVGGDRLILNVDLAAFSQVLLTMPSATKFYCSNGPYVILNQQFVLDKNSSLEWLPQCSILFPQAKVIIDTTFFLEQGSRLIGFDTLCFGFPLLQKSFEEGELNSKLHIRLFNCIGLMDRLRINKGVLDKIGGFQMSAIFFATPSDQLMLDQIKLYLQTSSVKLYGATLLGELLIVRLLDNDNRILNKILCFMWSMVRPKIIGCNAVFPRIWFT